MGGVAFALGYAAGRQPSGAETLASCCCRSPSWRPGASWACTPSGRPACSSRRVERASRSRFPVGLLMSAFFAAGSAFVDVRPGLGPSVIRRRAKLRGAVLFVIAASFPVDAREPATAERDRRQGRDGKRARRAGRPRDDRLRGERRPLLAALPARAQAASMAVIGCFVLFARSDDQHHGHRGAQVARELVGVARTDRLRLPDHQVHHPVANSMTSASEVSTCRPRRAPPGRQRPSRRPRGFQQLLRTVVARRGRGSAQCVLQHGGAVAHPSVRRRGQKIIGDGIVATLDSRGDRPDHALRAAVRPSRCSARSRPSRTSILAGRACASA